MLDGLSTPDPVNYPLLEKPRMVDPEVSSRLLVDAGTETIRFQLYGDSEMCQKEWSLPTSQGLTSISTDSISLKTSIIVTGKLHSIVRRYFSRGEYFSPLAVLWAAAAGKAVDSSVALLDLSASGYFLVGVDESGGLKDDLLVTNPRCGSGAGINLDRVLRKLSIKREDVDALLLPYLGAAGEGARQKIPIRADRCGVFASSATISDKNQGIPLDFALATTLKSEVLKACKHLKSPFDEIFLTGGVFCWQFARDCAADYFKTIGIKSIHYDESRDLIFHGLRRLSNSATPKPVTVDFTSVAALTTAKKYPSFTEVRSKLVAQRLFKRQQSEPVSLLIPAQLKQEPVLIGIDVGSTMAKIVICSTTNQQVLYRAAYSNSGDTIETVKAIFLDLQRQRINTLSITQLGLTGSARYQIQKALLATYPELAGRVTVLVENSANARGSVNLARQYLAELKQQGDTKCQSNHLTVLTMASSQWPEVVTIS